MGLGGEPRRRDDPELIELGRVLDALQALNEELHRLLLAIGLGDSRVEIREYQTAAYPTPTQVLGIDHRGHTRRVLIRSVTNAILVSPQRVTELTNSLLISADTVTNLGEIGPNTSLYAVTASVVPGSGAGTVIQVWEAA